MPPGPRRRRRRVDFVSAIAFAAVSRAGRGPGGGGSGREFALAVAAPAGVCGYRGLRLHVQLGRRGTGGRGRSEDLIVVVYMWDRFCCLRRLRYLLLWLLLLDGRGCGLSLFGARVGAHGLLEKKKYS